jgi:hypothetical protein
MLHDSIFGQYDGGHLGFGGHFEMCDHEIVMQ